MHLGWWQIPCQKRRWFQCRAVLRGSSSRQADTPHLADHYCACAAWATCSQCSAFRPGSPGNICDSHQVDRTLEIAYTVEGTTEKPLTFSGLCTVSSILEFTFHERHIPDVRVDGVDTKARS